MHCFFFTGWNLIKKVENCTNICFHCSCPFRQYLFVWVGYWRNSVVFFYSGCVKRIKLKTSDNFRNECRISKRLVKHTFSVECDLEYWRIVIENNYNKHLLCEFIQAFFSVFFFKRDENFFPLFWTGGKNHLVLIDELNNLKEQRFTCIHLTKQRYWNGSGYLKLAKCLYYKFASDSWNWHQISHSGCLLCVARVAMAAAQIYQKIYHNSIAVSIFFNG